MSDYPLKTPGQLPTVAPALTDLLLAWQGGSLGVATAADVLALATKAMVELGNADNTSDDDKPVSTAQATAIAERLLKTSNLSDLDSAAAARANLGATGNLHKITSFTASGTFTPHAETKALLVRAVGAGGGGGGAAGLAGGIACGGGGGAGGYAVVWVTTIEDSYTATIGAGGVGGAGSTASAGGTGGSTSFGTVVTCTGGDGGFGQSSSTGTGRGSPPGVGGTATTSSGQALSSGIGQWGQVGARFGGANGFSGTGGDSLFASGGGVRQESLAGLAGGSGAGGSGGCSSGETIRDGGAGGNGYIEVWEYR